MVLAICPSGIEQLRFASGFVCLNQPEIYDSTLAQRVPPFVVVL